MIKHLLVCFGIVLAFWLMNSSCKSKPISLPPNILLIVTDDMAFGDLSLTTNPYIQTPVLDKLAQDGAFASHFYVSPVCARITSYNVCYTKLLRFNAPWDTQQKSLYIPDINSTQKAKDKFIEFEKDNMTLFHKEVSALEMYK